MTASPSPRYEVRRHEHHGGGLYELEVTITFDVVELATGTIVKRFEGGYSASYNGSGWGDYVHSNLHDVTLAADGLHAEVHFSGGRVERVFLPDAAEHDAVTS